MFCPILSSSVWSTLKSVDCNLISYNASWLFKERLQLYRIYVQQIVTCDCSKSSLHTELLWSSLNVFCIFRFLAAGCELVRMPKIARSDGAQVISNMQCIVVCTSHANHCPSPGRHFNVPRPGGRCWGGHRCKIWSNGTVRFETGLPYEVQQCPSFNAQCYLLVVVSQSQFELSDVLVHQWYSPEM